MREKVLKILQGNEKIGSVTPESDLLLDFGLSSLEIADLVCEIEDELGVDIPDNILNGIRTVGDIYACVDGL